MKQINKKNKQILYIFLFFIQIGISQNAELIKLIEIGNKAYSEGKFVLAKETFIKATSIDTNNQNTWFNLAATELYLGEKDNACEHFYTAYLLGDGMALGKIKEFCPNFRNGSIMSMDEVEEKPKFIYEGKEYLLFEKNNFNPLYCKIFGEKIIKSRILKDKLKGKIYTVLRMNEFNALSIKVIKVVADDKDVELVKTEIISIFKNMVTYISAKHKGVNVNLFDVWNLPINYRY